MKVLIAAAATAVLFALPAVAQTTPTAPATPAAPAVTAAPSQCGALPAAPTLPDGATANAAAMTAANTSFLAWQADDHAKLECLRTEAQTARANLDARVAEFNAGAAVLNTAVTSWQAEVTEFNARNTHANRH